MEKVAETPMIKSHVANYTMRPSELEELCLFDFLCSYTVARRGQASLLWRGCDHPSKDRLAVKKLSEDKRRIPLVNEVPGICSGWTNNDETQCYSSKHSKLQEQS